MCYFRSWWLISQKLPNTACTGLVGRFAVLVFRQVSWLEVGSVKTALSRPAHQYPEGA